MARLPRTTILSPLRPNTFKPPRGQKPIYLPNFTLTLLRTPFLPPQFASFIVPLNFNKLDLKDYLYHAYNVPVLSVRSYVQQQRVRQDKPGAKLPKQARWYRPRSIKKMTIEMADLPGGGPFVWPDEEEDLEPWDKDVFDAAQRAQEREQKRRGPDAATEPRGDSAALADQAKALLEGKETWRPGWMDHRIGKRRMREREVEVDVDVNAV